MTAIEEAARRASEDAGSEPDDPLAAIQQELVGADGSVERTTVLVEDEADYALTRAWIKHDPDDAVDLARWA